jgi:hypothetical protein
MGVEDRIIADGAILSHGDSRIQNDSISDNGSVADIRKRMDGHILPHAGRWADPGVGVDALGLIRHVRVKGEDLPKGKIRVGRAEER